MSFFPRTIKSIQRGTVTLASVASNTATLSQAVNPSYSVVRLLGVEGNDTFAISLFARVRLTSSTQVTAYAGGLTSTMTVLFEVTEYYPFFLNRPIQEGVIAIGAAGSLTGTASVTAATGTGDLIDLGSNTVPVIVNGNGAGSVLASLSIAGTTITATRGDATNAIEKGWAYLDWR